MSERPVNEEMVSGYMDGFDLDNPEPSENRSASYRHGFANGRNDRLHTRNLPAEVVRKMADEAMAADDARFA